MNKEQELKNEIKETTIETKELVEEPMTTYTTRLENGVEVLTIAPDTKISKEEYIKYMNKSLSLLNEQSNNKETLLPIELTSSKEEIISFFDKFISRQRQLDYSLMNRATKYMLFASSYLIQEGIDYIDDYYLKMLEDIRYGTDIYEYYIMKKAESGNLDDLQRALDEYNSDVIHLDKKEFNNLYHKIIELELERKNKLIKLDDKHLLLVDEEEKVLDRSTFIDIVDQISYAYDRYKDILYTDKGMVPIVDFLTDEEFLNLFKRIEKESINLLLYPNDEVKYITLKTIYVISYLLINNKDNLYFFNKLKDFYLTFNYYLETNEFYEHKETLLKSWDDK